MANQNSRLIRIRTIVKLSIKNVKTNWRHSLATLLAIVMGFTAVSLFDGFIENMKLLIEDGSIHRGMMGHVVIERKGAKQKILEDLWRYSIDERVQEKLTALLKADARVETFVRFLILNGMVANSNTQALFVGIGFDLESGAQMRGPKWQWNVVAGKPLRQVDGKDPGVVALGWGLASKMGCQFDLKGALNSDGSYKPVDRKFECRSRTVQLSVSTEHSQINAASFEVQSLVDMQLRDFNDRFVMLPLSTSQTLLDTKRISRVGVLLKDGKDQLSIIADLSKKADELGLDLEFLPWIEHPASATSRGSLELLTVFRNLFLCVVALIAAMSVANSMMKSINERTREIGTLRSLGFYRSDISLLFAIEGFFLGLFSCLVGWVFAVAVGVLLSRLGLTFKGGVLSSPIPVQVNVPLFTPLMSLLVLTSITAVTSYLLARRAANSNVSDMLRHVA